MQVGSSMPEVLGPSSHLAIVDFKDPMIFEFSENYGNMNGFQNVPVKVLAVQLPF